MTRTSSEEKQARSGKIGRSKSMKDHFERIPDTPENIAKALFR